MIDLRHQACHTKLERVLREACPMLGGVGVARIYGRGAWDGILPRHLDRNLSFVRLTPGSPEPIEGTDQGPIPADETKTMLMIKFAITKIRLHHNDSSSETTDCAVLLRPLSYIFISNSAPSVYVPLPDSSGHDVLADQALLDAEFPGAFRIAA